jgi:hypothetical protein
MGRLFTAHGENLSLGTGSVLIALQTAATVAAGAHLKIHRVEVTQSASTTSAMVRLLFSTRDTAGTLTTTSVTPQNTAISGPASGLSGNTSVIGGTGRIGINSSADSGGTYTNHWATAANQLNGYLWLPVPEERLVIPASTVWCVRFATAPTSTTGWTIGLVFEEVF